MDYDKAIEFNTKDGDMYFNRGLAKYELKDYKSAIADYHKAIEIAPIDANAYYNSGLAKYLLEDIKGACLDWKKANELGSKMALELIGENCK